MRLADWRMQWDWRVLVGVRMNLAKRTLLLVVAPAVVLVACAAALLCF